MAVGAALPDRGGQRLEIRLAGKAGVQRLELGGGAEQQACSLRPAPLVECDLPPEMFRQSPPQVGRGVGFDGWQERERCLQGAGITLRRRGGQRTVGAPPRVAGQQRGPLEKR